MTTGQMKAAASNPVTSPLAREEAAQLGASPPIRKGRGPSRRSEAKRDQIVQAAMRHFAENGYQDARIGDLAAALGIAKGSIFQHFGSKDGLFLETYKRAVRSFPTYMDAPQEVLERGFFETLRHWLTRTEHLVHEDWVAYRVYLLGNYRADLTLRREINRFLMAEDPYGTYQFVRWGVERSEVRADIDEEMVASILDWTFERFQDALLTEELDPGLFRRQGISAEKKQARINQFMEILRGAIGTRHAAA